MWNLRVDASREISLEETTTDEPGIARTVTEDIGERRLKTREDLVYKDITFRALAERWIVITNINLRNL